MTRRVADWGQRSRSAARRRFDDQPLWGIASFEHIESLWRRRRSHPVVGSKAKIALQLDFYGWPSCLLKQIWSAILWLIDWFNDLSVNSSLIYLLKSLTDWLIDSIITGWLIHWVTLSFNHCIYTAPFRVVNSEVLPVCVASLSRSTRPLKWRPFQVQRRHFRSKGRPFQVQRETISDRQPNLQQGT